MNTQHLVSLTLSATIAILCGCSPKYYLPTIHNVPMLSARNQGMVNLNYNTGRAELTTAYTPSDEIGVMASGGFFFEKDDEQGDGGSGRFAEVGVGYYKSLSKYLAFDTYGIVGYGFVENHFPSTKEAYPTTSGNLNANLFRYGIQPSCSFHSHYVDAGLSVRMVGVSYSGISGSLVFDSTDQKSYIEQQSGMMLIEPALTVRAGYDFMKLQLQFGSSYNLTHPHFSQDKSFLSFGLVYYINP